MELYIRQNPLLPSEHFLPLTLMFWVQNLFIVLNPKWNLMGSLICCMKSFHKEKEKKLRWCFFSIFPYMWKWSSELKSLKLTNFGSEPPKHKINIVIHNIYWKNILWMNFCQNKVISRYRCSKTEKSWISSKITQKSSKWQK